MGDGEETIVAGVVLSVVGLLEHLFGGVLLWAARRYDWIEVGLQTFS